MWGLFFFGQDFPHESVSSIYLSMLATLLIAISKKLTIGSKMQECPLTRIRIKNLKQVNYKHGDTSNFTIYRSLPLLWAMINSF